MVYLRSVYTAAAARRKKSGGLNDEPPIRLHPAGEVLGVAEGLETALAARQLFGVPAWSCISAAGVESFTPPKEVRKVIVFGDNDASGTGQAAGWTLAKRLIAAGMVVEVKLPERIGTDFADEVEA